MHKRAFQGLKRTQTPPRLIYKVFSFVILGEDRSFP